MGLFQGSVEKAIAALAKLRSDRIRLETRTVGLEQELNQLRAVTSDQLLDQFLSEDEGESDAAMRVVTIQAQLSDMANVRAALIRRMQAAIVEIGTTRAEELRMKGKKLRGKLDLLSANRLKLLEQLRALEGGGAGWLQEYERRRGFLPLAGGGAFGPVAAPAFDKLAAEIQAVHREADAIEQRARNNAAGGRISGSTLDELLAACADPEQLAPLERSITSWFEAAAAAAARNWEASPWGAPIGGEPDPLPARTLFTIVWANGVLSAAESGYVHLENRRPTHFDPPARAVYAEPREAVAARGY